MKQSFKNINKTSLFITIIVHLFAYKAHAVDTVAIVNDIKGTVFVSIQGKTSQLNIGDEILLGSEVLTADNGSASLTDYYDHQFHLSNSSHIKFELETVQLRRGYLWLQSYRKGDSSSNFKLTTANSVSKYHEGESILSFDPQSTKTQLLVIKGKFIFQNIQNEMDRIYVEDGLFSFIKTDFFEGSPRRPTPVGFSSFKKITSLFNKVNPMGVTDHIVKRPKIIVKPDIKRGIASTPVRSGNIIYVNKVKKNDSKFLKSQLKKLGKKYKRKKRKKVLKRSGVTLRVYGADFEIKRVPASVKKAVKKNTKKMAVRKILVKKKVKATSKTKEIAKTISKRAPASVPQVSTQIGKTDAFEKGLKKAYKKQMRHSPEMNSLIKDLKNFDQDFKTAY
jgi:hypothetical protein